MIIVKLIGGLGNQMFQYAAGRRSANINNTELKLDITGYQNQEGITPRKYALNIYNIKEDFADIEEINNFKGINQNLLKIFIRKLAKFTKPYFQQSYVVQRFFQFDPNILKVKDGTYLQGHWASERYFKDIENIIREEFTFKKKPDEINKNLINKMTCSNSVSIHIRRGDYVLDEKTNKHHGVCNLDYYLDAVDFIVKRVKNPYFYIFSDDPGWVKQNLKINYPNIVVDHNFRKKDYEDIRLMSNCKHNIIANSSFSWWGAWLNNNKKKIVVAPKRWFNDRLISTGYLISKSWTKL